MQWLKISAAVAVVALIYFWRLDRPLLWGDEADTGIFARNVLRSGYPVAYDGRNVRLFAEGSQVSQDLVCKKVPWVSLYLGAASLAVFGDSTAGLRTLFVLVGVLSFFPIYAVLKTRVRCPEFVTALALVAPQVVLFHRNARYYAILTLLEALLVWHLSRDFKSTRTRFVTVTLILTVMFHTHPLAAGCAGLALVLFCLLANRQALLPYAAASAIGFGLWLAWYVALGPYLSETPLAISLIASDFRLWLDKFVAGLTATVLGADQVGCLPLGLWLGALTWLFARDRRSFAALWRQPLPTFVLLGFAVQTVATAALLGSESAHHSTHLRYMPHLLVFSLVALFVVLNAAISRAAVYVAACVVAVALNVLTLYFWLYQCGVVVNDRKTPITWVAPVYSELLSPPESSWELLVPKLRHEAIAAPNRDAKVLSLPPWTQDVALFYLGDLYIVLPYFQSPNEQVLQVLRAKLGEEGFGRLLGRPLWIIDSLNSLQTAPPGYVVGAEVPFYRERPDDGGRPELMRHTFCQPQALGTVRCFRLQDVEPR